MRPLCVDLDGTLIRTDVLFESAALLLKRKPWLVFALFVWMMQGKAHMKREISNRVTLNVALLPYNREFVDWVSAQHEQGRTVVLATASDQLIADAIAMHLPIFDFIIGSDGHENQKGSSKLGTLAARYGREFAYAGNSSSDLAIWRGCAEAIVVNASSSTAKAARALGTVTMEFPALPLTYAMIRQVLRVRVCQMFLVASILPTMLTQNPRWAAGALAICCLVSGLSLTRDLVSLEQDRANRLHATRPIASGAFPIAIAFFLAPLLVAVGLFGILAYIALRKTG